MLLNLVCMTLVLTISISTAYSQATAEPAEQSKFKKNDILGNIRSPNCSVFWPKAQTLRRLRRFCGADPLVGLFARH